MNVSMFNQDILDRDLINRAIEESNTDPNNKLGEASKSDTDRFNNRRANALSVLKGLLDDEPL